MTSSPIFRGWYIVIAVHVLLALIFGAAYSFGAFFSSIQSNFDAGKFTTASIFSFTALLYYAVGVFSGAISDRISIRTVTMLGIWSLALGFGISSFLTESLPWFLATFCLLAGLGVGLVYVPAVTTIQRWFVRYRATASGIALAGTGLGTLVGPVVAGELLKIMSWQDTMRLFAAAIAIVGTLAALAMRGSPEALGLHPDGHAPDTVTTHQPPAGIGLSTAIQQPRFWWYFTAIFLGSIGIFLALVHINPYAQQLGMSVTQANILIGLIGVGNIGGRLVLGRYGDKIGALRFLVMLTIVLAVLCALWASVNGFIGLAIFALLFGAANGGCIALYPSVAASWFGTRHLGAILGALYIAVGAAAVAGGSAAGLLFDLRQTYTPSILLAGVCAMLSAGAIILARRAESPAPDGLGRATRDAFRRP